MSPEAETAFPEGQRLRLNLICNRLQADGASVYYLPMSDQIRCLLCSTTFSEEEIAVLPENQQGKCPKCGDTSVPCDPEDDVTITINWHELRLLCIWAENWGLRLKEAGRGSPEGIYAVAGRLKAQHPNRLSLTLIDEIRQIAEEFPDSKVESNHPYDDGEL